MFSFSRDMYFYKDKDIVINITNTILKILYSSLFADGKQ